MVLRRVVPETLSRAGELPHGSEVGMPRASSVSVTERSGTGTSIKIFATGAFGPAPTPTLTFSRVD